MADVPDTLVLKRHRDLAGERRRALWVRRAILAVLAAFSLAGLLNVFGQRPHTVRAEAEKATLSVHAPTAMRAGLLVEARFRIVASQELRHAILVLDPGWAEGMSINTVEPSPVDEASRDGRLAFTLGHIPAGGSFLLFVQFQVNPTNVAWNRRQDVELYDGDELVAAIHRTVKVFP